MLSSFRTSLCVFFVAAPVAPVVFAATPARTVPVVLSSPLNDALLSPQPASAFGPPLPDDRGFQHVFRAPTEPNESFRTWGFPVRPPSPTSPSAHRAQRVSGATEGHAHAPEQDVGLGSWSWSAEKSSGNHDLGGGTGVWTRNSFYHHLHEGTTAQHFYNRALLKRIPFANQVGEQMQLNPKSFSTKAALEELVSSVSEVLASAVMSVLFPGHGADVRIVGPLGGHEGHEHYQPPVLVSSSSAAAAAPTEAHAPHYYLASFYDPAFEQPLLDLVTLGAGLPARCALGCRISAGCDLVVGSCVDVLQILREANVKGLPQVWLGRVLLNDLDGHWMNVGVVNVNKGEALSASAAPQPVTMLGAAASGSPPAGPSEAPLSSSRTLFAYDFGYAFAGLGDPNSDTRPLQDDLDFKAACQKGRRTCLGMAGWCVPRTDNGALNAHPGINHLESLASKDKVLEQLREQNSGPLISEAQERLVEEIGFATAHIAATLGLEALAIWGATRFGLGEIPKDHTPSTAEDWAIMIAAKMWARVQKLPALVKDPELAARLFPECVQRPLANA